MGAGWSSTTINDPQEDNSRIVQQYSGTCSVSCQNEIDDVSIAIINSSVGGNVEVTQSCAVNSQCAFQTTQSALSDAILKAQNSSGAALRYLSIGVTTSNINSPQSISQAISESVTQSCNLSSTNDLDNVSIFAANSQIGGSVVVGQVGDVKGGCALQTSMTAQELATASNNSCAQSGSKKSCGGKGGKGSIGKYVLYGIGAIVLFMVVMMVIRLVRGSGTPKATKPAPSVLAPPVPAPTQVADLSPAPASASQSQSQYRPTLATQSPPSQVIVIENSVPGGVTLRPTGVTDYDALDAAGRDFVGTPPSSAGRGFRSPFSSGAKNSPLRPSPGRSPLGYSSRPPVGSPSRFSPRGTQAPIDDIFSS